MADRSIETLMREALLNAETGSAFITKGVTMGQSLESILFSTTKGNKVLCGLGIETRLVLSAFTSAAAAKQAYMVDDLFVKVDNQLRIKSNVASALIEWADCVLDKVQTDQIIAAGPADGYSYHIIPVSGVGGRQVQIDIDIAALATMGVGTFTSAYVTITPYYTDMPIPQFSVMTGSTPATGTGNYKLQVSGDFVGNGFLESGILIGDGTIIGDDLRIIQEDGKLLLNQKCFLRTASGTRPLEQYWQSLHQKTKATNSAGFRVNSTIPWSINSTIELDIPATGGTFAYLLVFKNSSTSTQETVQGQPSTPKPEPRVQPQAVPTAPNTRLVGSSSQGLNIGHNVKRLFGV